MFYESAKNKSAHSNILLSATVNWDYEEDLNVYSVWKDQKQNKSYLRKMRAFP